MLKDLAIRILFLLLGNYPKPEGEDIGFLFGRRAISDEESRAKRWRYALARIYADKNFLDFLYYHAEKDKERVFRGVDEKIMRGARVRTLFIVYSAKMAYNELRKNKTLSPDKRAEKEKEIFKTKEVYKKLVDIGNL